MRCMILLLAALALVACGSSPENDPVLLALKGNPPNSIPARHLPKLRRGAVSCDIHNEGLMDQYMTCWWPSGKPTSSAILTYYGGGLWRPHPENIIAPGGKPISKRLPI